MDFPALPDTHGIAVLALIVVALFLFSRDRIPLESSSLGILCLLLVGFELFPYQAEGHILHAGDFFDGFGHEALIAVCALMIAGQGLVRTGALEPLGRSLSRAWSVSPLLSLLLTLLISAILSAFVNNVPIVVLLLPILISVSIRTGKSSSGILLPVGLATVVGGMATTIGTSTNLLVVSVAADLGMRKLSMFDFFLPAAMAGGIAILYLWLIAPRMLPKRQAPMEDVSPRLFSGHLSIPEDSKAVGMSLAEVIEKTDGRLQVREIRREPGLTIIPLPDLALRAGDQLGVQDSPQNLKEFEEILGAQLYSRNAPVPADSPLVSEDQQIAEIVVTQGSPLLGTTLARRHFSTLYQLTALALHRAGQSNTALGEDIKDIRLRLGDVLLVQGPREKIATLKSGGELLVLDATEDLPHSHRAPMALAIMVGIVALPAFGIVPIAVSALAGVMLMLATACLRWRDAVRALSTPVIMIVVSSLALGQALLQTGGADYLARLFVTVAADAPPAIALSGLMLVMAILTNIVSNNAAAVIGTPVAISIANQLGLPAEPYVLAVLFGANMSYATPMAYKTNLLVMNAGGYSFSDFMRVGIPMLIIVWLSLSWLLPQMYGL
ncbi:SLC13 family permease [Aestuariispira insulae]|uniref:Di/tricarboxylate transporter n=1 Tax=Aestuariispira insulae TaxID=1461337 RepID=A0A3D9H1J5_9PROT|nr:SLC13 family permease [Aestuariispira insulae]RED43365.1 di/tricarboxylate transporter [Aestuariispira insulae]